MLPLKHPLARVGEAQNAILVHSQALESTVIEGPGAGALPTGSAIVSDVIEITRNLSHGGVVHAPSRPREGFRMVSEDQKSAFYMRLPLSDRPGALASVAQILAEYGVSLANVEQHVRAKAGRKTTKEPVPVVLTTHPAPRRAFGQAYHKICKLRACGKGAQMIPIFDPQASI